MVHGDRLAVVLSDFARTMVTDFPIQSILDHLVERIVEILPVSAAGVTLISQDSAPRYIAASDKSALRYERLQTKIGQGPCLLAYESGEPVSVPDLANDDRFPQFSPAAVRAGLAAVFTFPLHHGSGQLGALNLYRDVPGSLDTADLEAAQTLADVVAAYLLNAQARDDARETSDRLHHNSRHDPLTGLPNRAMLHYRLEHAAQRVRRTNANAAILFADLDRFKQVNDTYGHHAGDQLLLAVAQRLSALVRPGDTLARVSGDEFVLLCEDLHTAAAVEALADRVDTAFAEPFQLAAMELSITASVGVAFAGPGEDISQRLVVEADTAMYQTKRKGGAGHRTIDLRASVTTTRSSLEAQLSAAVAADELDVAYQPIVRCSDAKISSVEALVRWEHPQRGSVSAALIVAVAEQSNLIAEIGTWVMERSFNDRSHWLRDHPESPIDLAVNVSGRQLKDREFSAAVSAMLARTGMDPTAVVLEMTEDVVIDDSDRVMTLFNSLRELGIRLALDDFGTGYSSLSYLLRLPVNILKIDQTFISHIGHPKEGAAIVAAITNLAHVLGLSVVAEGVETQQQHDGVRAIGCDFAQGYFYAPPMTAAAISARLESNRVAPGR